MQYDTQLLAGRLQRRYKRFLADVVLDDGTEVTAHCPNPGSMMGLVAPGLSVWLSKSADPKRKLAHTLEMVELESGLVGVNTTRPNALVAEAIVDGTIRELADYATLRREVRYGRNSRVDIVLEPGDSYRTPCFVEVKNVHLRRCNGPTPTAAEFPDCVTVRGTRHLRELAGEAAANNRAVMVFLVQRDDCDHFRPAEDIDPLYARTLREVVHHDVEALCYACTVSTTGIAVARRLPVVL